MKINLKEPKIHGLKSINKEIKRTVISFEIISINDNCINKVECACRLYFKEGGSRIINIKLWEGKSYESIGEWTQSQAESRIIELI